MYQGPSRLGRSNCNLSNLREITNELSRNESAAERNGRQIDPTILRVFADKGELFQQNTAAAMVLAPALACDLKGGSRRLFGRHLYDGEVGNIGPLFLVLQHFGVQLAVKFAHPRGTGVDANKDGGSDGYERLDRTEHYVEGFFLATDSFENLKGGTLSALQRAWRKNGEMGRKVREVGMQFAPEGFDELPGRVFQIRHQRIANRLHTGKKLYRASQTGAGQKQEQQRDLKEEQ